MSINILIVLLIAIITIAVPPPSIPPEFVSSRLEVKTTFYNSSGIMTKEQLTLAFLNYTHHGGILVYNYALNRQYNDEYVFAMQFTVKKHNITKNWQARLDVDGNWECDLITFPFPDRDLLQTSCNFSSEDTIGAKETWRYNCNIEGLSAAIWVEQNFQVAILVRTLIAPFGPFPGQVQEYFNTGLLLPTPDIKTLQPPIVAGCNITLDF
jgi:hypothetical protein